MAYRGYTKLAVIIGLVASALFQIITQQTWWFMQNVNLIFHEAGHVLLGFFGRTVMLLGGSIFEIGTPLLVSWYFYRRQQYFASAAAMWWLVTALVSVAIYVGDAQERSLSLITGDIATHDWYQLLQPAGLLPYDDGLRAMFLLIATVATALIVLLGLRDKEVRKVTSF